MFSRERNVVWKMCYMKCGSYLHLISNTALHITHLSYYIPFTGKHEPNKLTCSQLCDFIAQLVRALRWHRRGHGFESRWVTWIFQVHETIICYMLYVIPLLRGIIFTGSSQCSDVVFAVFHVALVEPSLWNHKYTTHYNSRSVISRNFGIKPQFL